MPNLERKTLTLADAVTTDDGAGSFMGYASRWDELDAAGDIVVRGAYTDTLPQFIQRGFIAWGHDWMTPVATIREATEDDQGLLLTADFHSDDVSQRARQITTERMARGKFMGLSIGYTTDAAEDTEAGRLLKRVTLYETSLVTVPALASAGVTSAKAAETKDAPAGSYEARAEAVAAAYQAQYGGMAMVMATFPDHAILCVMVPAAGGMGMGMMDAPSDMSYVDVPYVLSADGTVTLGTPTPVEEQTTYVPTDGKGLLLPARRLLAACKAGQPQLSTQRRERLTALRSALHDLGAELDALLEETTPRDRGKALWLECQRIRARRLGVAV